MVISRAKLADVLAAHCLDREMSVCFCEKWHYSPEGEPFEVHLLEAIEAVSEHESEPGELVMVNGHYARI